MDSFDISLLVDEVRANEPGKRVDLIREMDEIAAHLLPELREGDMVITIGAGDVYKVAHQLADGLR